MSARRSFWLCLGLAIGTGLANGTIGQQPDIEFRISPLQERYVLHEPVYVRATVRNISADPVTVPGELDHATQRSSYDVSQSGEDWRTVSPGYVKEPMGDTVTLAPGEEFSYEQLLIWDASSKESVFPAPGTWRLLGALHGFGRLYHVSSDPIEIPVDEPTEVDKQGSEVFAAPPVINLAMNFGEAVEAVSELKRLVAEHADSRFSDYAGLYLAQRMMEGFFDRKPDLGAAIAYLEPITKEPSRAPQIQPLVLEMLAQAYARTGQARQAAEINRRLVQEHPGSSLARSAAALVPVLERLAAEQVPETAVSPRRGKSPTAPTASSAVPSAAPQGTASQAREANTRVVPAAVMGLILVLAVAYWWRHRK